MKRSIFSILFILFLHNQLYSQFKNIKISNNNVSLNYDEVAIAVNPTYPDNVIAGSNIEFSFSSFDGGKSWTQSSLYSPYGVWGDPCIVFNSKGDAFYGHLSNPGPFESWIDRIIVQKSNDMGLNWDSGKGIGLNGTKKQDKEWLVVDTRDSRDFIYCFWTEFDKYSFDSTELSVKDRSRIRFAISEDEGSSWNVPIVISDTTGICIDSDFALEGVSPAVGLDGEIYVSWCFNHKIYIDKSTNGGVSFGKDRIISDQFNGWDFEVEGVGRVNGFPVLQCDTGSSRYRGSLYMIFSDQRNGDLNTDVFFMKSSDNGVTWSEIKKVNDDTGSRHQFFPWMSVDPLTGYIYIIFYDRRDTEGTYTDVYVARSKDGGESFENIKISESSFKTESSVFFGDYISIGAYHGKIYPVWTRMDGIRTSIWTTVIEEDLTGIANKNTSPKEFGIKEHYPNPSSNASLITYTVDEPGLIEVDLYNSNGDKIKNVLSEYKEAGEYKTPIDSKDLSPGIYFVKLFRDGKSDIRSCIIIK